MHPGLVVMLIKMTHLDLPLLRVGSSSGHGGKWPLMRWTGRQNIFAHEAQFVMHHPQMIGDGALVLAYLSTPGAVGHPIEVV